MSCEDPNPSQELRTACACQKAVNVFASSFAEYQAQMAAQATSKAVYDSAWTKYKSEYQIWQSRKATKRKELVDEVKIWNRCVLWTGVYGHDNWCQSDTGFGRQTGAGGYGCDLGQGKGTCQRTTTQVDEELNKWVGSNPPPIPPSGGSNGDVTPCSTCNPPIGNNILCCSSIIQDIIAGKNVSINAAIDCSQNIVSNASSEPSNYTPDEPVSTSSVSNNNSWLLAFVASVIVICILCSMFFLITMI